MRSKITKNISDLKKNGITYLKNIIPVKDCKKYIKEFEKTTKFFEKKHKHLGNKGQVLQNYFIYNKKLLNLLHLKPVDALLKKLIDKNYVLISTSLTNRFKRNNKKSSNLHLEDHGGKWHHDSRVIGNKRLDKGFGYIAIIMFDEFEEDNGCTLYVDKSHLIRNRQPKKNKNYKHKKILGKPGTVAIIDTALWHKSGEPSDLKTRWSIFSYYGPWFMKPYFDFPTMMSKKYKNIDKKIKKILHFNSIPPENELKGVYTLQK